MVEFSATILRNKGVQVEVAVLVADEGGAFRRSTSDDGSPITETRWVRFDSNAIADIEEQFGSLADFEKASRESPFNTIRRVLGIVWEATPRDAGKMMLDGKINDYSTAVGVALSIANGVDPTQAARLLKVGVSAGKKLQVERGQTLEEALIEAEAEVEEARKVDSMIVDAEIVPETTPTDPTDAPAGSTNEADSPGPSGSNGGPAPDGTTPSSGLAALPRSSSPSTRSAKPTVPPNRARAESTTS